MPENHMRPKSSSSLKHEMIRQDIDEKWKRTMMTPTGVKIIRIQPSLNYDSLHKYQHRPETYSPRSTSTPTKGPASPRASTARTTSNRGLSATSSIGTQTSNGGVAKPGEMVEKPPAPDRPVSSRSCPSATFNSRSRSCQPTHMYMKDNLRRAAKQNRPASHVHSCSQSSAVSEYPRQPRSPRRFDGTVVNLPKFVQGNEFLTHEDLSMGQKQYIWGIARVYSMSNLMDLKQRQYQSVLDYDFRRNMQDNKLKEHERLREWREYQRYTKFIKRYEQRIPRGRQRSDSASPCKEVSHIHRHVVKGWTTNPRSDEAYRPVKGRRESEDEQDEVRRLPDDLSSDGDSSPLSGHYRLIISKTPQTENDSQETEQPSDEFQETDKSRDKSQEKEQSRDISQTVRDDEEAQLHRKFTEAEESNYL